MTTATASTCVTRVIAAPPQALYDAFMDPTALAGWLPPDGMSGVVHAFDGRVGGGYDMSLFYGANERVHTGKTSAREDRVRVRFLTLEPGRRIVEAVSFVSDDPALKDGIIQTIGFEPVAGGTEVSVLFTGLPPGLAADNETGSRMSLANLARWVE